MLLSSLSRLWVSHFLAKADREFGPVRRLFVDISTIKQHDARTGIQRVVRAIVEQLELKELDGIEIFGVRATSRVPYHVTSLDCTAEDIAAPASREHPPIRLGPGDLFLGLDLSAHLFAKHERQLKGWQMRGAQIAVLVYDLLPYSNPEWFNRRTCRNFRRWLWVVGRRANVALPISRSVAVDLSRYLQKYHRKRVDQIRLNVLPLSGDIQASAPTHGIPSHASSILAAIRSRRSLLMVGTVEPRKGHAIAVAAHQYLWSRTQQRAPYIVIVGKPGWKTEAMQEYLASLSIERDGVIWLDSVSDEFLEALYAECYGLLVTSIGEGYCLPIHEAISRRKPVLARNLTVLQEFQSPLIQFFEKDSPQALSDTIERFIEQEKPTQDDRKDESWTDTTSALIRYLLYHDDNK
jgi:glycosyltransferase involved in cell wall biosynthesis